MDSKIVQNHCTLKTHCQMVDFQGICGDESGNLTANRSFFGTVFKNHQE
jgi:hypothetical protein